MNKDYSEWWFVGIVAAVALVSIVMMISPGLGSFSGGANILGGAYSTGCTESDGGKNFFVKGTVISGDISRTDSCSERTVVEYYCEAGRMKRTSSTCEKGCENGACINNNTCGNNVADNNENCDGTDLRGVKCIDLGFDSGTLKCDSECHLNTDSCVSTVPKCTDSDGGNSPYVKGKVNAYFGNTFNRVMSDECMVKDSDTISHSVTSCQPPNCYVSEGQNPTMYGSICVGEAKMVLCPNGCSDGACVKAATDLSAYPSQYFPDRVFNGKIVVGSNAPTSDVVAAIDLMASLQHYTSEPFPVGIAVLDTSITNPKGMNLISIGNPCNNIVTAALLGNPANCLQGFAPGRGKIQLFTNNGKTQIVVAGYGSTETMGASYVLTDYEDYQLRGNLCMVLVPDLNTLSVDCIGMSLEPIGPVPIIAG